MKELACYKIVARCMFAKHMVDSGVAAWCRAKRRLAERRVRRPTPGSTFTTRRGAGFGGHSFSASVSGEGIAASSDNRGLRLVAIVSQWRWQSGHAVLMFAIFSNHNDSCICVACCACRHRNSSSEVIPEPHPVRLHSAGDLHLHDMRIGGSSRTPIGEACCKSDRLPVLGLKVAKK